MLLLEIAQQIQGSILPRELPQLSSVNLAARYVPMAAVAGDFYDFLPYGKGRLAVALGDVSGKGTAAALFGSLAALGP